MESVKVLDFGVAKLVRELAPPTRADPSRAAVEMIDAAGLAVFTCAGSLLGTPCYMAPEQVLNAPDLDQRADIWAFGIVAFECLTGRLPFVGEGLVKLFANIECGIHPLATSLRPDLPAAFDAWFEIACATDPARRFRRAPLRFTLRRGTRRSMCARAAMPSHPTPR